MTTSTFSEVSPGDGTYMITDNDGTVKILVDIDFDPGWYAMPTYLPRAKVFPTEQLAKDAAVSPPPPVTEGYQLTPKSGNTWHGDVKLANFNATDPGKNNNWIVIWTVSTTGDADEFYDVHRLPPQGSSYGWRVKRQ